MAENANVQDMDEMDFLDDIMDEDLSDVIDGTDEQAEPVEVVMIESEKTNLSKPAGILFDNSELASIPGVITGDMGLTVSRFPVDRMKFSKDSRTLVNVVSDQVAVVRVHYHENLGNYICFGEDCCEVDGLARVKYILPINVYDTDRKGKPTSPELTPRALSIGQDQYDDLMMIKELNGDLSGIDILISCKDEQYQKLSFQAAGPARSVNNPKWKDTYRKSIEFWKENYKNIVKSTARVINKKEWTRVMKEDQTDQIVDDVDFDKMFD